MASLTQEAGRQCRTRPGSRRSSDDITRPVIAVGNFSSSARMPTMVPSNPLPSMAIARAANSGRAASRSLRAELDTIATLRGPQLTESLGVVLP